MPKPPEFQRGRGHPIWPALHEVNATSYRCGYCGDKVSSHRGVGYHLIGTGDTDRPALLICPNCNGPTFVYPYDGPMYPGPSIGAMVSHVPDEIEALYDEARSCATETHYTASVLLCRKILMHIAVAQGADPGLQFVKYVDHLVAAGYVPPNGKVWVDHIRKKGNEANHEIIIMGENDARDLIKFVEMLLRFIYEFPNSVPSEA